MDKTEFQNKLLMKEEHDKWASKLREYVKQQKKVSILHYDDENALLESVYTPLTVVRRNQLSSSSRGNHAI